MSKVYPAGWITVPGKGRRWRTAEGEYMMQRPAGGRPGVLEAIRNTWSEADRRLGGWLPGGGTASPVTRAVFPPQSFPQRSKELERATGVSARIVDPEKSPTLVRRVAPQISPRWGENNYANPLLNEVGIAGYRGGATPEERYIEFHELGHLSPKDKKIYSRLGVLGRTAQGVSDATGNLPPVDLAAGMAMQAFDAREEDRAERFAKAHARVGNFQGPKINPDGTSNYGNSLRKEGRELVRSSLQRMGDPFGAVSGARQFVNQIQAGPVKAEIDRVEEELSTMMRSDAYWQRQKTDGVPPEAIELSRKHTNLQERLRELGINHEVGSGQ
jgi:hypothetical protein